MNGFRFSRGRRLASICVAGACLLITAVFYIQFYLLRPIGEGPAGPAVDRRAFSKIWTDRSVRLVGIGDSITAGLGAKSPDHTFFSRIRQNPADEYADMQQICLSVVLANLESENLAISGSTSKDHLAVIEDRLLPQDLSVFGLVVMTTGGNDLIHSYGRSLPRECAMYGASLDQAEPWIDAFRKRLETMVQIIKAAFPGGCEIYLADIYDPTDGVGDAPSIYLPSWPDGLAIHAKYNEAILDCIESHANVFHVPLHQAFLGHGSHCRQFWRSTYVREDPHYWYFSNIEDPNDRGYDAIRRIFLKSIVNYSELVPR